MHERLHKSADASQPAASRRRPPAPHASVTDAVARCLRANLQKGTTAGEDLARHLGLHRRTLNRRLRAEGTTFQQVLDEVRYARARELLADVRISIADISLRLGYAEPSAFTRAFRRWAGTNPLRWRTATRA